MFSRFIIIIITTIIIIFGNYKIVLGHKSYKLCDTNSFNLHYLLIFTNDTTHYEVCTNSLNYLLSIS